MSVSVSVSKQVALFLLEIEAIKLNLESPYTWASGWKSPIYCDNRISLSYPHIRTYIKEQLSALLREKFREAEVVGGVATAGIPQGALVADYLGLPFLYVRPKPKEHGLSNQIEGRAQAGQQVVVIEDLVSTGGSSMKAIDALRRADMNVLGMISIFSYSFKQSIDLFDKNRITYFSLSNYETLIEVALQQGYVKKNEAEQLKDWRMAPDQWG